VPAIGGTGRAERGRPLIERVLDHRVPRHHVPIGHVAGRRASIHSRIVGRHLLLVEVVEEVVNVAFVELEPKPTAEKAGASFMDARRGSL
jgi:hypothetical protein